MDRIKKMIMMIIRENQKWTLFMLAFVFFVCLGMCLSWHNTPTSNIFFGADNARAFSDLVNTKGVSHYRIKVHPLMLMMIQPVTLFIKGIVQQAPVAVILAGSLAGGLNVVGLYEIFGRYVKNTWLLFGFLGVYAFSFSTMLFTSIPETFIYASVYLIMFWNFVLKHLRDKDELKRNDYIILSFFGITCFGLTLTNYASYLIGVSALFFYNVKTNRDRILNFLYLNMANGALILLLNKIQQRAWKGDTPFFPATLLILRTAPQNYEETQYMNFTVSFVKIKNEFFQTFVYPLTGGGIGVHTSANGKYTWIGFNTPDLLQLVITFIAVACVVYALFNIFILKKRYMKETGFLLVAWMFNLCLHFIYGSGEAFMYTPHFIFIPFVICAMGLSFAQSRKLVIGVTAFAVVELISNLHTFQTLIPMVIELMNHRYYAIWKIVTATLFMGVLFYIASIWMKSQFFKVFSMIHNSYQAKILFAIKCYSVLIFVVTFWVYLYRQ